MNRPTLLLALSAAMFAATAGAEETTVYKTTNADGTVTYSQTETDGSEARIVHSSGASTAVVRPVPAQEIPDEVSADTPAARAFAQEACDIATANLAVFDTAADVTLTDGSADAVPLTAEQKAAARAAAEQQIAAYCEKAAKP